VLSVACALDHDRGGGRCFRKEASHELVQGFQQELLELLLQRRRSGTETGGGVYPKPVHFMG
jgi:hypothetical protein